MKKILIFVFVCLLFSCKTKEEKALELIKNEMFKTLYDFKSYEPIETKVDSAFNSVYTDSTILALANVVDQDFQTLNYCIMKVQNGKGDLYDAFMTPEYKKVSEEIERCASLVDSLSKSLPQLINTIKERSAKINNDFCGWKITHKFRSKSKVGISDIHTYLYIVDNDISTIKYKEDINDALTQKLKKHIKDIMENPSNTTE